MLQRRLKQADLLQLLATLLKLGSFDCSQEKQMGGTIAALNVGVASGQGGPDVRAGGFSVFFG